MPPLNDDERKEPYDSNKYKEMTRKKSRESQGKSWGIFERKLCNISII
jgi:hypothetical protein